MPSSSNQLYFEQIQVGIHAKEIKTSISKNRTRAILRTLNSAGFAAYLREFPLHSIGFGTPNSPSLMAYYSPQTRELLINTARAPNTYGEPFIAGKTTTVSSAGDDIDQAMSRSLLHEIGHHVFYCSFFGSAIESEIRHAYKNANHITRRAAQDWQEWFSESLSAYYFEHSALKTFDSAGYAIIERIREELGLP